MRTENLVIVYVDIAGFTARTAAQSREDNERMLHRFDEVVRPAVRCFEGRVIKTIGDAFLLTFRSPTDALLCSMAVHDRLAESNGAVPQEERFAVRAAVNVGEVRVEKGDVFGEAVNIAARIESKTPVGEIYFSEAVYLAMTRAEVPLEAVGEVELKGITNKVRLYRIPHAGEASAVHAGDNSSAAPEQRIGKPPERNELQMPFGGKTLVRVRARSIDHVQGTLIGAFSAILPYLYRLL